jgi:hypothetical protein
MTVVTDEQKCEQIIILMKVAGMTLTEINTLNDIQRVILSKYFMDSLTQEQELQKERSK